MRMLLDTSTLISLARSAQLPLLARLPLTPVLLVSVWDEAVTRGQNAGHADATAIAHALADVDRRPDPTGRTVDDRVLAAAVEVGTLATNDLALGRRAVNLGARWLRTVDLVILGDRTGTVDRSECRAAVTALHHAGRITEQIRDHHLEALT